MRGVDIYVYVGYYDASHAGIGVVPALNIKSRIYTSGGTGSIGNPYKVTGAGTVTVKKPTIPTNLKLSGKGTSPILNWSKVTGAEYYYVYYKKNKGTFAKVKVTQTSKIITGLTKQQKYYFKVTAVNAAGESAATKEVSRVTGK